MSVVLAADIGGTNIRAAVVDAAGHIVSEQRKQIDMGDRSMSAEKMVDRLSGFFGEILADHPAIQSIGAGFPGFFIGDSGVLAASPNLPNLKNVALAQRLSDILKIPVSVQNDALCAAIGEHHFGAGQGANHLLHITLGTGVGGGLILNHAPYTGEHGMAMEFGHLRVVRDASARICGCGGHGCVETYASATAIALRYAEATGQQCDAKSIFQRAQQGDAQAMEVFTSAGAYLGASIAEAIKLLDISTVSISGGPIGAWDILHPAIMQSLDEYLIPPLQGKIKVLPSTLRDNAGLLGAAALAAMV